MLSIIRCSLSAAKCLGFLSTALESWSVLALEK